MADFVDSFREQLAKELKAGMEEVERQRRSQGESRAVVEKGKSWKPSVKAARQGKPTINLPKGSGI